MGSTSTKDPAAPKRLGIFVSGFWWSGSGAVVDTLLDCDRLIRPAGGEFKPGPALSRLIEIAQGRKGYGEWPARYRIYPDLRDWDDLFGDSLVAGHPVKRPVSALYDGLYRAVAPRLQAKKFDKFERKLDMVLKRDFRSDRVYKDAVHQIVHRLKESSRNAEVRLNQDEVLRGAVTSIIAHVYDLWADRDQVPFFDNMISGENPQLLQYIDERHFGSIMGFFVRRDPRDQFTEIVSKGKVNRLWALQWILRRYRSQVEGAEKACEAVRNAGHEARVVSFEDFVTDRDGIRRHVVDLVEDRLRDHGLEPEWSRERFNPKESEGNIGRWKHESKSHRAIRRIERELEEYLHPLAD